MRVAVVHYHLRPGGVTRVIENAVAAIENRGAEIAVLSGEEPADGSPLRRRSRAVPGIGYASPKDAAAPETLAARLEQAARSALGGPPDLWHFHNHALGKNPALALAPGIMAGQGRRLLLQIHDFAEDGRPLLFRALREALGGGMSELGRRLYPQGTNVHYAAINRRDLRLLEKAGVAPDRLHFLPDPVAVPRAVSPSAPGEGRLFLYPTRAIRRKNLGEFLFWAARGRPGDRFAVTLAPRTSAERTVYERWVDFARREKLPVEFEAGTRGGRSLAALLAASAAAVTTSVAEGFGLAFLEPYVAGRPLVGRKIPEITEEIEAAGIDLSPLYERLPVPLTAVERRRLREKIAEGVARWMDAYGRRARRGDAERAREAAGGGEVDFGRLDEDLQMGIIRRVRAGGPSPGELCAEGYPGSVVGRNREIARKRFGAEAYARGLTGTYRRMLESAGGGGGDDFRLETVLDFFLDPRRFFLLRA